MSEPGTPPRVVRRLAGILSADVKGYSTLMRDDEIATVRTLTGHRAVIATVVGGHGGRVVDSPGDNVLAEFPSVVDAVEAAVAIQTALRERNAALPATRQMAFRIGVNLGDVIVEGDRIYGDGINLAARLEALAEPGGVVLSATALEQVRAKLPFTFESIGAHRVKNVAEPVLAYRVVLGPGPLTAAQAPVSGPAARPQLEDAPPLPAKPSIAVMPFDNGSGDPGQEYLADGITEELITALARLRWLFVIGRNSSFAYKGRRIDARSVGRELGVRYVLEGSVRRSGPRVRISGQLVEAATSVQIWADRYEGTLEDIFDLEDEFTRRVAGAVEPTVRQAEIERARRRPPERLDAWDRYLQALPHAWANTLDRGVEALRLLDEALRLDPEMAPAHALAAWCHEQRIVQGGRTEEREVALAHARAAVAHGSHDPLALALGGFVIGQLDHDYVTARAALDQALALNENSSLAFGFSSLVHAFVGDAGLALEHAGQALRLSPLDPLRYGPLLAMAFAHLFSRRFAEAAEAARKAIQANPGFPISHTVLVAASVHLGDENQTRAALARCREVSPGLRVSFFERLAFTTAERLAFFCSALRQAGLPD